MLVLSPFGMSKEDRDGIRKMAEEMNRCADVAMKTAENHSIGDSLVVYRAIIDAVDCSLKCEEYDMTPGKKGVIKPEFGKENAVRLKATHERLISAGSYIYRHTRNGDEALNAFKLYIKSVESPSLRGMEDNSGIAAYHIAQICLDSRDYKTAESYADVALRYDNSAQKGAEIKARCMRAGMVTALDSARYLAVISRLYEAEPTNETYFSWLMRFYGDPAQRHRLEDFVDRKLESDPDNAIPWILKGEIAMHAQRWEEAADAYKHADEIEPGSVPIMYNIGVCLNNMAMEIGEGLKKRQEKLTSDNETVIKDIFAESMVYLERVKEKDPQRDKVDWVRPLYIVYSVLEENDKAEGLKPLVTGFKDN